MAKAESQTDIVAQFLQGEQIGAEFDDELRIPQIASHFEPIPDNAEVKKAAVRLPNLDKLPAKSRGEIADVLAGLIDYKPGVVGFDWVISSNTLEVMYVDGFQQRMFSHEGERDEFVQLVITVLKSRRNITRIAWLFGEDHVKVTYIP